MPSRIKESCEAVILTCEASESFGHGNSKLPTSKRFIQITYPSSSQYSSLIRLRRRFRKI